MSTRHWRQAPIGSSSGWSQNRGMAMPSISAARITSVPLGTLISNPSMVTVTVSVEVVCAVIGSHSPIRPECGRRRVERAATLLLVLDDLVAEVLDSRVDRHRDGVAECAERPAHDVVTDVQD